MISLVSLVVYGLLLIGPSFLPGGPASISTPGLPSLKVVLMGVAGYPAQVTGGPGFFDFSEGA